MLYCYDWSQVLILRLPMKKISFLPVFLLFLVSYVAAQTTQKPSQQLPPPTAQADQQEKEPEHKVTPEEAKELFQSVDEVLKFASTSTLFPMKHPVKKAMVSREQVERYIDSKFKDDVDRIRFERSELVLKKFGLLPRTFDLHTFLIKLLGEQVAGYYDEKTKTINLLDWVHLDMQKPVMAHELTHALQDQSFDLGKMIKKDEEIERRGPEDPNALIKVDEESSCRTAVLEGQAMIVLVDYILAPAGRSVENSPQFVDMMQASMDKRGESPLFDNAPLLLREELVFPYSHGMKFIQQLLAAGGKKLAYTGVLERMPLTTREILEPQEYLAGHRVPPLLLPEMGFLKKEYEPFDAGAVGEFDVNILLKQYTDEDIAKRLAPEWRGGAYYAAGRKGVKPGTPNSTAHIGLIYVSRWSSDKVAKEFAKIYASALPGRYSRLEHLEATAANSGREKYSSADGPIFIDQQGDLVVVTESFDDPTADLLIQAARKQVQNDSKSAAQAVSENHKL
jgi:hypothetical protein